MVKHLINNDSFVFWTIINIVFEEAVEIFLQIAFLLVDLEEVLVVELIRVGHMEAHLFLYIVLDCFFVEVLFLLLFGEFMRALGPLGTLLSAFLAELGDCVFLLFMLLDLGNGEVGSSQRLDRVKVPVQSR